MNPEKLKEACLTMDAACSFVWLLPAIIWASVSSGCMNQPVAKTQPAWSWMESHTENMLTSVWGSDSFDVYVVGTRGTMLHSVNQGIDWVQVDGGTLVDLLSVWGSSKDDVFVSGADGTLFHTSTEGKTWTSMPSGVTCGGRVWGTGPDNIYFVSNCPSLNMLHSDSDGATWTVMRLPLEAEAFTATGIGGVSRDDICIIGLEGAGAATGWLHTVNSGENWSQFTTYGAGALSDIWANAGGVYYLSSQNDNVYSIATDGLALTNKLVGSTQASLTAIWASGGGMIYVAGLVGTSSRLHGMLSRANKDASSWDEAGYTGKGRPFELVNDIWGSVDGSHVYAVGGNGMIVHTTAHGS